VSAGPRTIRVEKPIVERHRVEFRWSEPDRSPWVHRHGFFLRYPETPVDAFSDELLLEIFLALQMRSFALHAGAVRVELPVPLPEASIEYWRRFHRAMNVEVGPATSGGYSPWRGQPVIEQPRSTAHMFGGGKDSTLAKCALAEIHGEEEVLLIQLVHPGVRSARELERRRVRQEQLMIEPALRGTRLAAQMVETDLLANLTTAGRKGRPHTALYTMTALPVLLHRGCQRVSMSNELTAYWWRDDRNGPSLGYARSRPEVYAGHRAHLESVAGIAIELWNTHFPISEILSFKILLERYPQAFSQMVMCVGAPEDQRWCLSCKKCAEYVHLGLMLGHRFADVPYERFWDESSYIQGLLSYIRSNPGTEPRTGNVRWDPCLKTEYHFASFCHSMATLRTDEALRLVPPGARPVIDVLASAWGNTTYPDLYSISGDAIELVGTASTRAAGALYAQHAPIAAGPFRGIPYASRFVDYDFSRRVDRFGHPLAQGS
jgi:hypothetical protein